VCVFDHCQLGRIGLLCLVQVNSTSGQLELREGDYLMKTKGEAFAGLSVALVTPFSGGDVDYGKFREQIEFQIAAGTDCLVPVGTTGESPTLSHEEQDRVIAFVVETVAGRAKVMPGTGSNSTAEALRLTKFAEKAGADAALQVAPYYNKPTQQGFYEHFKRLAEETGLPQCIYNIPGRTAKNIEPETIIRLAELENIALVKEATGSLDQASQIITSTNLTVLSGDDSLTLPLMAIGGRGVISVVGNIVPMEMRSLIAAMNKGDLAEAQRWHRKLFPLCRDMLGLATNPIPIKAAMKLLGRDPGELRLPMTPLEDAGMTRLKKSLSDYGLL
jgi:4-hydroxy-tetrahydrodipicolinate synthase